MIFLDTDVLIECLRGIPAATAWLKKESSTSTPFHIPGIVAMELVIGARDKVDLERIHRFLGSFTVIWPEATEFAHAYQLLGKYRLASGLSIPDCLIAAMSLLRSARLYSFNLKHFQVVSGLVVEAPYARP
jgi:tRNA(fMet)-specific endonuclease VapC